MVMILQLGKLNILVNNFPLNFFTKKKKKDEQLKKIKHKGMFDLCTVIFANYQPVSTICNVKL